MELVDHEYYLGVIAELRAALTQFVACCDTAPPTSLMIELGMACEVARTVLFETEETMRKAQEI